MISRRQQLLALVTVLVTISSGAPLAAHATVLGQTPAADGELRWRAGNTPYTDARGSVWQPDAPFATGGVVTTAGPVWGTHNPTLYERARAGNTTYRLPVPTSGTWAVVVHFAATATTTVGVNVTSLRVESQSPVAIDVAAKTGFAGVPYSHLAVVAVTDGAIDLRLTATAGQSRVSAISAQLIRTTTAAPKSIGGDDFQGAAGSAPSSQWTPRTGTGAGGWGNGELQTYTTSRRNSALDGLGNLVLTARRERTTGTDGIAADFTSARLDTLGHAAQFGHVEARIQMPSESGLLPAFWLLGSSIGTVGWPACGEIDVVEALGDKNDKGGAHGTLHGPVGTPVVDEWSMGGRGQISSSLAAAFHVYAIDWYRGVVSMSVDGVRYVTMTVDDLAPGETWVFDQPFFLTLNVAVGGTWPGTPTNTWSSQSMRVDYVDWSQ
ncbi:MAG: glycoside hydrolase family 16 [Frankiales bacterium]|nr:glycoside hydrolase family 16 [Frankiales bacterium]